MKVVIGSDHAGFKLKQLLKERLVAWGHQVEDVGTDSEASVDYPDFGAAVGRRVVALEQAEAARGLAVCGSGIGICIAANKVPGVRAALVSEPTSARLAREHNDVNVLCLGERVVGPRLAEEALKAFLETPFEGGRHADRVSKLRALDRDGGPASDP